MALKKRSGKILVILVIRVLKGVKNTYANYYNNHLFFKTIWSWAILCPTPYLQIPDYRESSKLPCITAISKILLAAATNAIYI
ncbi:hypothetical protein EQ500_08765 [Lactobacillus sp. XV13L]|nr:hypothetical protein [Lactobacillus sp. XV13L]